MQPQLNASRHKLTQHTRPRLIYRNSFPFQLEVRGFFGHHRSPHTGSGWDVFAEQARLLLSPERFTWTLKIQEGNILC